MPIYEYRCDDCGSTFDVMARITEAPPENCESCNGGPIHKLISQTSFVLKGSGWASDGYSSAKSGGKAKTSAKSDSGSGSSSSSSSSTSSSSSSSSPSKSSD
ncbi:MAG: zinc ribbon domain-containing protein [Myxococcota bacterium]|jgi:putative FmdB family regulatory protein|nr:zinc ribbon domain-containing protein [Myxococcota bacterium]